MSFIPDQTSLSGRLWALPDICLDSVDRLQKHYDLPEIIARLLVLREVEFDTVQEFLYPTLRDHFPDPFSLNNMEDVAVHLAKAVESNQKIGILGDFDVDGATSTAILYRFFKACGMESPFYIPDRLSEGYGPSVKGLQSLKEQGAKIVIMVDCGISAVDITASGIEMGLEIIILDHHQPDNILPPATFIVDPKLPDDESGLDMLAACAMAFLTVVAVNKKLRESCFYQQESRNEPDLRQFMDLVALGTICDMVPLIGPNRLFVRQGFPMMRESLNPGLCALIQTSRIEGDITPHHAGFSLGPRINAGSRVHKSDLGAKLLTTDDPEEAVSLALNLDQCNDERRAIQSEMEKIARDKVVRLGLYQHPVIIVEDDSFHQGLSGLVAGRLKDKYGKPACVITFAENPDGVTEGRGSGRSIQGVHIAQSFLDAQAAGILVKGGGHAMAGGFTLDPSRIEDFRTFMAEHVTRQLESIDDVDHNILRIDTLTTVRGLKFDVVNMIHNHIGPFGQTHEEPLFLLRNVKIHKVDIVGKNHVRTMIGDWEGGPWIKAMLFRGMETPLGQALMKNVGAQPFDLCGHLKMDVWNGNERVEMHILDGMMPMSQGDQHTQSDQTLFA